MHLRKKFVLKKQRYSLIQIDTCYSVNFINLAMYILEHNLRFLNDDMVYITQREFEGFSMMTWFICTREINLDLLEKSKSIKT